MEGWLKMPDYVSQRGTVPGGADCVRPLGDGARWYLVTVGDVRPDGRVAFPSAGVDVSVDADQLGKGA